MLGQSYNKRKKGVLKAWDDFETFCKKYEKTNDLDRLRPRANNIINGFYTLAVAGEAKAGKSTMINALLGERILPTDILQKSSAIIEIFKSEKKHVEVTYANGNTENFKDNPNTPDIDEAVESLRELGSILDKYRDIPTTLIDDYIIRKEISPIPIDELERKSGLPLKNFRNTIEEYVKERNVSEIPLVIRFGYPLKYADGLKLIDTPGVNAVGGLELLTNKYLNEANAVIFLHSLRVPIESGTFNQFLKENISDRAKKSLFLLLTHSETEGKLKQKSKEDVAKNLFKEEFDETHIFSIDSVLELIISDIKNFESPLALLSHYEERKNHFETVFFEENKEKFREEGVIYDDKYHLLKNVLYEIGKEVSNDILIDELQKRSNFLQLSSAINKVALENPEQELADFVNSIKTSYDNVKILLISNIDMLNKKIRDPEEFEVWVTGISEGIEKCKIDLSKFNSTVNSKFLGAEAYYLQELREICNINFERTVSEATQQDNTESEEILEDEFGDSEISKEIHLSTITSNFGNAMEELVENVKNELVRDFTVFQNELVDNFQNEYEFSLPTVDFSTAVASAIENVRNIEKEAEEISDEETEDNTYRNILFTGASTLVAGFAAIGTGGLLAPIVAAPIAYYFSKKGYEDRKAHRFMEEFEVKLQSTSDTVEEQIVMLIKNCVLDIEMEFEKLIDHYKNEIFKIQEQKKDNDEIRIEIDESQKICDEIESQLSKIEGLIERDF